MVTSTDAQGSGPRERLARLRGSLSERPRVQRELILFGLLTLFGLIVMPFVIWIASNRVLGPYTHGQNLHAGPLALVADYYIGLAHGSAVFWSVAMGPAAVVLLIRLFLAAWRALP
jgi:hypothetical protein